MLWRRLTVSNGAFQVVIAGGGVAALEAALALRELAGDRVATTIVAPNAEFRYRPLLVHEPFKPAATASYSVAEIAERAGARLLADSFKWLDPSDRDTAHRSGAELALRRRCFWPSARGRIRASETR